MTVTETSRPGLERYQSAIDRQAMLGRVWRETSRQIDKWGIQHHPDGTGGEHFEGMATAAKQATDRRAEDGTLTWADILIEEVFEAFAESDPKKLVEELLQVAAVATSWAVDVEQRA